MEIILKGVLVILSAISLGESLTAVKEGRVKEFYVLVGTSVFSGILIGVI